MPRIREYDSQISAQGSVAPGSSRRADALDFGADFTVIGDALSKVGDMMREKADTQAVTEAQLAVSRDTEYWQQETANRQKTAQPGDTAYVPTLQTDMGQYFTDRAQQFDNPKAREYYRVHAAQLHKHFTVSGIDFQGKLAGDGAINAVSARMDEDVKAIRTDPSLYAMSVGRLKSDLETGSGQFKNIKDMAKRQELFDKAKDRYALTAEMSRAEKNPEGWLKQNSPEVLERNKWTATTSFKGDPALPAGMRNDNPFNIKFVGQKDAVGPSANRDQGDPQAVYASAEDGTAAGFRLMLKKFDGGKISAAQLIAGNGGWTPGNMDAAANVAKLMGVGVNDNLDLRKPGALAKFGRALITQEQGSAGAKYSDAMLAQVAADVLAGKQPTPADAAPAGPPPSATESYRALDPEKQMQLQNHALTRYNQLMAVERAGMERKLKDAEAMISLGKDPGEIPAAMFERAYGTDGQRRYSEYQGARAIVPWADSLHGKSGSEIQAMLQQEKGGIELEGAAGDLSRLQLKAKVAESVLKARSETPVEYVVEHSPYAKDAFGGMMKVLSNPQEPESRRNLATSAYADAVRMEQRRLGMPESIVSNALAASILDRMGKAKGQDVAAFMRSEAAAWGSNWPTVVKEMGKQMPAFAIVLGQAPNIDTDAQALISEAAKVKPDEWRAGIEKDRLTALDQKLNKGMSQFGQMLGMQEGGQQTFAAWRSQAESLAIGYMHQGLNETDASNKAIEKLVSNVWELKGTYRIPKTVLSSVPQADIERGANVLLRDTSALPIAVPPAPAGVRPEDWKRISMARIGNDVFWSNMPGDKGVVLYKKVAPGEFAAVPSSGGGNIEYTWAQLAAKAKEKPVVGNDPAKVLATGDKQLIRQMERERAANRYAN